MQVNMDQWLKKATDKQKENKLAIKRLAAKRGIERELPELHDEAFSQIDCLSCARCCKTISPRFKKPDLHRIAKHLGMRESALIDSYLYMDTDGDYVVKSSPCPFLLPDNSCDIYDVRPRDCRRYPYTDSGDFLAYPQTTALNTTVCPAVYYVLERLKQIVP
jgi:uncharacterized protein